MIWLSSDWHLFDPHIIEQERRPFSSLNDMHEALIRNWNQRVRRDDVGVHLGDVISMSYTGTAAEIAQVVGRLKGRLVLLRGNHDRFWEEDWWLEAGFHHVTDQPLQVFHLAFTHEPARPLPHGLLNIHGHFHRERIQEGAGTHFNVAVDLWGYRPVRLAELVPQADEAKIELALLRWLRA